MEAKITKEHIVRWDVKLTGYLSEKKYPEPFRLIRYYDEEDDRELLF